jgi:hypothetical protein
VLIEIDSQAGRLVYPIWLRFFTLAAALAAFFLLVGPSSLFSNSDPSLPWNEQGRILPQGRRPQFHLSEDQPRLTNIFRYKTEVELDGQPQGEIIFLIYPDGTVKGIWNGEYNRADDTHCLIMAASFAGNIDPTRKYIENGVKDPSKLYFITAGAYNLFETTLSTKQQRNVSGFVYVRGWLDPNYAAVGELIITQNKKTFKTFSWTANSVN